MIYDLLSIYYSRLSILDCRSPVASYCPAQLGNTGSNRGGQREAATQTIFGYLLTNYGHN